MRIHIGGMNNNTCTFTVGYRIAAQFDSRLIEQLSNTHGVDVKAELKGMLSEAVAKTGLQITPDHDKDLTDVVDKYVDLIVNAQKG